jgi:hypothetical protein
MCCNSLSLLRCIPRRKNGTGKIEAPANPAESQYVASVGFFSPPWTELWTAVEIPRAMTEQSFVIVLKIPPARD